jgi:hypothetical protein
MYLGATMVRFHSTDRLAWAPCHGNRVGLAVPWRGAGTWLGRVPDSWCTYGVPRISSGKGFWAWAKNELGPVRAS